MLERMFGYCAVYPREEFISSPKRAKGDVGGKPSKDHAAFEKLSSLRMNVIANETAVQYLLI